MLEFEQENGERVAQQDWASNVVLAFLAGHETTRWSTLGLMSFLMAHPAVLDKLSAEMRAAQAVRPCSRCIALKEKSPASTEPKPRGP